MTINLGQKINKIDQLYLMLASTFVTRHFSSSDLQHLFLRMFFFRSYFLPPFLFNVKLSFQQLNRISFKTLIETCRLCAVLLKAKHTKKLCWQEREFRQKTLKGEVCRDWKRRWVSLTDSLKKSTQNKNYIVTFV